jgi:hypothetical protein
MRTLFHNVPEKVELNSPFSFLKIVLRNRAKERIPNNTDRQKAIKPIPGVWSVPTPK